jgi:hypothetical protein
MFNEAGRTITHGNFPTIERQYKKDTTEPIAASQQKRVQRVQGQKPPAY